MIVKGFRRNAKGKWFAIEGSLRTMITGDVYHRQDTDKIMYVKDELEHVEVDDPFLMSKGIGQVGMHEEDDEDDS